MDSFRYLYKDMKVNGFILAAGFGKRMLDHTKNIPKPLLPVNNVPLIYYSLYNFHRWNIKKIYINVHYHGDIIMSSLKKYPHAELIFSEEKNILGTAGGIRTAIGDDLEQNLVILNPDTILLPDISDHPRSNILPDEIDTCLYLSLRKIDSQETGFDLDERGSLRFADSGRYYYIGYSIVNTRILKDIPVLQKSELGDIWKKNRFSLTGKIFKGSYFDCGNAANYDLLRDKRIYSSDDIEWSEFLETCCI